MVAPAPHDLPLVMQAWLNHLQTQRRYSPHTLASYRRDLQRLAELAREVPLQNLAPRHIRQFLAQLHATPSHPGALAPRSLARLLAAWRGFFQWWAPQIGLPGNPVSGIRPPKAARSLPKALSVEHTQVLLDHPAATCSDSPLNRRDLAMMETLYSSGLRVAELTGLDWRYAQGSAHTSSSWLNLAEKEVVIRGKGNKSRQVPLGAAAIKALQAWLAVREQFLKPRAVANDQAALFLGTRGCRITPRVVQHQLAKLAQRVGLPVPVHPHMLRHSFASHVLQSAQDLRAVQEMLGHANLSSTQIYTSLDFQHLAQVYDRAHPRARRKSGA